MKKAFLFILSASLIIAALASCGTKPPEEEPTEPLAQTAQTNPPAASTPEQKPEPEPEAEPKQAAPKEIPEAEPEPEQEPAPEPEPEETPEETQPAETSLFAEVNETVYVVDTNSVNLRSGPGTSYDKVGSLSRGQSATRTGVGIDGTEAEDWSRVTLADGTTTHVSSKYLSTSKPTAPSSKPSTAPKQEAPAESDGGGSGGSGVGSDGLTEQERKEIAELQAKNRFGGDTQLSKEDAKNAGTPGDTAIYH